MVKNKKKFYKKWWFLLIVIIAVMLGMVSCGDDGEKIDWSDIELGEMIPQPDSDRGKILTNTEDSLSIYIHKMSKDDYKAYIAECEKKGYTVEAEKSGNNYDAYSEEGYFIRLWYNDNSEELHINLDAPEEMGNLEWPNNELAKLLPEPKSGIGKISRESSEGFYIYVGETPLEDYHEYVEACSAAGFDVDYEKGDEYYRAYDENGNYISLAYAGNRVMTIEMKKAEETVVEDEGASEPKEDSAAEPTAAPEEESVKEDTAVQDEEAPKLTDGMRPEFKEAMDAYESFMNEYCEFMKKYTESDGTDLGILMDYAKYVKEYAEFVEKFEKWDTEEMNAKETAYYIDVQTRVNKKLLEVAE